MPALSDLATLQDCADWIAAGGNPLSTSGNNMIGRLITSLSGSIYAELGRQVIIPQTITERYDGVGNCSLLLRNWPVLSIASLVVDGCKQTAGVYPTGASPNIGWPPSGYFVSPWDGLLPGKPQALNAGPSCWGFPCGSQNISITYTCGYAVQNEMTTIGEEPYQYTPLQPWGPWASDMGVVYASTGIALKPVVSAPIEGQYIAPVRATVNENSPPVYTFASSDHGSEVLISYGFVPADLNNACIEWVAERLRYSGRIGQRSQSAQGQQTASYDMSRVPPFIQGAIRRYRNVVPSMAWG
jgi:hypothetical protein